MRGRADADDELGEEWLEGKGRREGRRGGREVITSGRGSEENE